MHKYLITAWAILLVLLFLTLKYTFAKQIDIDKLPAPKVNEIVDSCGVVKYWIVDSDTITFEGKK